MGANQLTYATTYSVDATQAPLFGVTFNILTGLQVDTTGHVHKASTTTVTIPDLTVTENASWTSTETAAVVTDIYMRMIMVLLFIISKKLALYC